MSTAVTTNAAPAGGAQSGAAAPAQSQVHPYMSASLYVGDLNPEVNESMLFEIFNAVGPVASVRVCRDVNTRRSLEYAYVNFHQVEDAERALEIHNFKPIKGRACRIMWKQSDPLLRRTGAGNIFVKNLDKNIDNKALYDTFSVFGNILSCKIASNAKGESLGYGFVHFESQDYADQAIRAVDGKVIGSQKVTVSAFKSKAERGVNKVRFTNLYINNIPLSWDEKTLEATFSKFGTVTSSMLSKPPSEERKGPKNLFAFVNYAAPEEASEAVKNLNGTDVGEGQKLYVGRAQKREERSKELKEKFEAQKAERQKKYIGVNVYVKNLNEDVDDEKLRSFFGKFGNITSAVVMKDNVSAKSKGFGFVCFSTTEEANKAVMSMNGQMFDSKPLYVALAQRREVRKAQLEVQHQHRLKSGAGFPPQMYQQGQPMYYQSMPQRNFVSYPQMMQQRGMVQPGYPQMGGIPGNVSQYQLTPMNQQPGRGGGVVGRGAGGSRRGGPRGQAPGNVQQGNLMPRGIIVPGGPVGQITPQQVMQQQQLQQQQLQMQAAAAAAKAGNVRYGDNVRNQQAMHQHAMGAGAGGQPEIPVEAAERLTIKMLAAAPEDQKKRVIGEKLFPLINASQPQLAGKITGMLLEMDNGELIHLLESGEALQEKIKEALSVLESNQREQENWSEENSH